MGRIPRAIAGGLLAACWMAPLGAQAAGPPDLEGFLPRASPAPPALFLEGGPSFTGSALRLPLGGPALLLGWQPEALAPEEARPGAAPGLWNPADPWTERRASLGLALGGRDWDLRLLLQDEIQRMDGRRIEARGFQLEAEFRF